MASSPSHILNRQRNTPVPLKFLPEARRYKVYKSFTDTPKHLKNLTPQSEIVKQNKKQHTKKGYIESIPRYDSGDTFHSHSHDLQHIKQWVEDLSKQGVDAGLTTATPQYFQAQGQVYNRIMEELISQLNVSNRSLGSLVKRVWNQQHRLFLTSIDSVYNQSKNFRNVRITNICNIYANIKIVQQLTIAYIHTHGRARAGGIGIVFVS